MSWTMTIEFFWTHSDIGSRTTLVMRVNSRIETHQFPVSL